MFGSSPDPLARPAIHNPRPSPAAVSRSRALLALCLVSCFFKTKTPAQKGDNVKHGYQDWFSCSHLLASTLHPPAQPYTTRTAAPGRSLIKESPPGAQPVSRSVSQWIAQRPEQKSNSSQLVRFPGPFACSCIVDRTPLPLRCWSPAVQLGPIVSPCHRNRKRRALARRVEVSTSPSPRTKRAN